VGVGVGVVQKFVCPPPTPTHFFFFLVGFVFLVGGWGVGGWGGGVGGGLWGLGGLGWGGQTQSAGEMTTHKVTS